ncbi:MAG: cupin domain-containing protein [Dehalococcoidia bacterium]|nr:cupin domain-containing protein [Dehalococcoidia bacterium]
MSLPAHIPQGNYPASTTIHLLDLEQDADRLLAKLPGHRRQAETLAREGGTSVVMMAMEAGDLIKEHSAPSAVAIHLLRGMISLNVDGKTHELRSGQLAFLQPGVPHDVSAQQQSVIVLTLSER